MNLRWRLTLFGYCLQNFLLVVSSSLLLAEPVIEGWQQRAFVGNTRYSLVWEQGREVIRADTQAAASMLYKAQRIDLKLTPLVSWRWKVAGVYRQFNERDKSGDDYPARFYVVSKTGPLPWQTLALNYVWSSNAQPGDEWPNAYTSRAMMIVLRAGDAQAGQWLLEQRNVVADFKRVYGVDVSHLEGYAIMVDGDNTGSAGTAWFSDIRFLKN